MADRMLAGVRVLVCEDDPVVARIVCAWLIREGAVVLGPFTRVPEALVAIDQHGTNVAVAVLDWNLVDGNTQQIAKALAALRIPFIFCTSDESQISGWPEHPIVPKSHLEWVVPRLATQLKLDRNRTGPSRKTQRGRCHSPAA